jgi:small subunit ribosomal protein S8
MMTFPVGDFLIRIKNAAQAGQKSLEVISTNEKAAIVKALEKAGFIENHTLKAGTLVVNLMYSHKEPVLMDIKLVSKPGKRVYLKLVDLIAKRGSSIYLINSPKGVVSSKEAIKLGIGGEVIAEIW